MNEFKNPLQDLDCNELSISDQNQIISMLQSEDLDLIILAINVLMNSKRPAISINIQLKIIVNGHYVFQCVCHLLVYLECH